MSVTMLEHMFRAGPRRALPRTCRPAQDETTGSYLLRLVTANRITGADLVDYLTAGTSQSIAKVSLGALASASGQPSIVLAYALPELRSQYPEPHGMALRGRTLPGKPNTVRPACRRCTSIRTSAERIDMWYRHDHNICLRHHLWIGPGAEHPRDQADLAWHPEIEHAQVRHRRLIRAHGHGIVHTRRSRSLGTLDLPRLGTALRSGPRHCPAPPVRPPGLAGRRPGPGPPRGHLSRGHHAQRTTGLARLATIRHVGIRCRP
ncbi:TniQ family protein [Dactylosporangium sp. NPDC051484]|uniref:TniQ family protein n=1 Tax=Dactylosporangium sp. NPDC051484 TaxID=3154942 RepID=UPI00344D4D30